MRAFCFCSAVQSTQPDRDTCPLRLGANALCLAGWRANSHRPAVQDGPVQLAPTLVHLPVLTPLLPRRPGGRKRCRGVLATAPDTSTLLRRTLLALAALDVSGAAPGRSGQPGTRRGRDSRRWTTGAPPSCPGWTELVGSGGVGGVG